MESCAVHLVSHFKCNFHLARFGWFTMEHIREMFPPGGPLAIWKQPRLRFGGAFSAVCGGGGVRTTGPFTETWETEARHGFFPHIFVKLLTEVSTVDFLFRGTPVGLLEIGGSPEPQWPNGKNNLSFQSFLHRSCLRVECHVVCVISDKLRRLPTGRTSKPRLRTSSHQVLHIWGWRWCRPQRGQTKSCVFVVTLFL